MWRCQNEGFVKFFHLCCLIFKLFKYAVLLLFDFHIGCLRNYKYPLKAIFLMEIARQRSALFIRYFVCIEDCFRPYIHDKIFRTSHHGPRAIDAPLARSRSNHLRTPEPAGRHKLLMLVPITFISAFHANEHGTHIQCAT